MGIPPARIDVLTKISGVEFPGAWSRRIEGSFGRVRSTVIGLEDLIANKRAAGRPQDLADVDALERSRRVR